MKGHRVTIKDIARMLNISPSTVSYALNDHPNINPKTKQTVKDLAKKLNYKPNKVALSLLQNESKIIGLIIPEIIHHFFFSIWVNKNVCEWSGCEPYVYRTSPE